MKVLQLPRKLILISYATAWVGLLILAILNATFRELLLVEHFGQTGSQQLSVLTAIFLFFIYTIFVVKRVPLISDNEALKIGLFWALMTAIFELFMVTLIMGESVSVALAQYDLSAGSLWPVLLVALVVLPLIARRSINKWET